MGSYLKGLTVGNIVIIIVLHVTLNKVKQKLKINRSDDIERIERLLTLLLIPAYIFLFMLLFAFTVGE